MCIFGILAAPNKMAGEVENPQMNEKPALVSGINLGRLREKVKFYIEKVCYFRFDTWFYHPCH